jgi:2,4-dienoyl-CoA reductase (NADPH2)
MQDNAVESISGCSYENICDEGMEISVGGKKRLLPVDTIVICAGGRLSPRYAKTFLAMRRCSRAHVMFRDTPYLFFSGQEPLRDLEAGLKAKNASVWCIGGAEVAAELDAKRAIDQGAVFFRARRFIDWAELELDSRILQAHVWLLVFEPDIQQ